MFPIVLDLFQFTPFEHTLTIVATDSAGQPSSYLYTFSGVPYLDLTCSVQENVLSCNVSNNVTMQSCSFDGQPPVSCSLPLDFIALGFSLGDHNVTVFVTDSFTQTNESFIDFILDLGPIDISLLEKVSIIEGRLLSSFSFRIAGQTIGNIPFNIIPLTYQQYSERTGITVDSIFSNAPPAASSGKFVLPASFYIHVYYYTFTHILFPR